MRYSGRVQVIFTATILVILLAAGCGKTGTTTTAKSTAAPTSGVKQSGDLRIALASLYDEKFYPIPASPSNMYSIVVPFTEVLGQLEGAKVVPMVAESWQLAPDGASWIYKVRKGIKFSNGDALTAADVKFSLDGFLSKEAYNRDLTNWVSSTEKVDDYTVRLITKGPQPFLPYLTAYAGNNGMVMPKAYFEKVGPDGFQKAPVGSGPWKFVSHAPGDSVKYEAVSQHWRIVPEFKTLAVLKAPEETTRLAMLRSGQADVAEIALDSVKELEAAGMKTHSLTAATAMVGLYGAYDPRAKGKPTADIRVRKALSLAINREEISKSFFHGKATPVMPPYAWDGTADIDVAAMKAYAAKVFGYDPAQAKQLLAQAGHANGFKIDLYTYTMGDAPYLPKLAEILQGYWLKIGVDAKIVPTEWSVYRLLAKTAGGPPADQIIGNAATMAVSNKFILTQGLPSGFLVGTGLQLGYPGIPELERIVPLATVELDPKKRAELNKQIMTLSSESYVFLTFGGVPYLAATSKAVNITFNQPSNGIVPYAERAKHAK
ncbi:MAG: ABC transporter substrate-binding protein [Chloroflexi bacterium]|nr:ABC transporter substrate-binding protein [Chloroflexota bacterium]